MTYHITFLNAKGEKLTVVNVDVGGTLCQSDVPNVEKMVNEHPLYKEYGSWKYLSSTRSA